MFYIVKLNMHYFLTLNGPTYLPFHSNVNHSLKQLLVSTPGSKLCPSMEVQMAFGKNSVMLSHPHRRPSIIGFPLSCFPRFIKLHNITWINGYQYVQRISAHLAMAWVIGTYLPIGRLLLTERKMHHFLRIARGKIWINMPYFAHERGFSLSVWLILTNDSWPLQSLSYHTFYFNLYISFFSYL